MQHRDMLFRYANRHDFIARPSNCLPRTIFLSPFSISLSLFFSLLFFVICTPNRGELLQYGSDGGGGSAGSRKSQINPFVIPHRSFQPVRISTTRFYAISVHPKLFLPSCVSLSSCQERKLLYRFYLSFSRRLFSTSITPYLRYFFFLLLLPLSLVFRCIFVNSRPRSLPPFLHFSPFIFSPSLSRNFTVQVSATCSLIAFVSYAFPA